MQVKGLSLIELLIVMIIIAILAVMVTPLSHRFMGYNLLTVRTNSLLSIISYAKNMALLKGQDLTLSPLCQNNECDWSNGMRLFVDQNKSHQFNEEDQLLYVWSWDKKGIKISLHGFISDNYLIFSHLALSNALAGNFVLCYFNSIEGVKVTINRLGRMRESYFSCE